MNRCANASCPTFSSTRIPQSNQKCRKRGGILEQRRRPIVKFQSDFALSHEVAMRLKRSLEAPLSDRCSEAQTHRLRCGRIVPRTSCPIATAESGLKGELRRCATPQFRSSFLQVIVFYSSFTLFEK